MMMMTVPCVRVCALSQRKKREEEGGGEGGGGSIAEDQRVVRRFRQVTAMDEEGSGRKGVKDKSLLKNVCM